MKKVMIVLVTFAVVAAAWFGWRQVSEERAQTDSETTVSQEPASQAESAEFSFANPKKGAHFESSTPAHTSILAAAPHEVVIDFNFDLASNSTIVIEKDGRDYGEGNTSVDANKLGLRRQMDTDAPDGLYTVKYNGCWPDRTCHDGHFQFAIDRTRASTYQDFRSQNEVTIKMSEIKFQPMNIRIKAGTKVTWVNDDSVEHYVNTDSHPAHSHVPDFNSRALGRGESYSHTFREIGAVPYHCSAHAADMTGTILVES